MAFRIVSIENPAEVHVANGQLLVEQDDRSVTVPVSDMLMLVASGPNIRMSTMAQAILADAHVIICHLGRNHHPAALTIPMVANTRQTKVAYEQVEATQELRDMLWQRIVTRKIENQARALAILGLEGAEEVWGFSQDVLPGDSGNAEGAAARAYFSHLHPGLNRRTDDPLNACLNYGYAIVRAIIARDLVTTGFVPAFGLHHHGQLNALNLADDMIEPYRPCVDLIASEVVTTAKHLSREQRSRLRDVTWAKVLIRGREMGLVDASGIAADSLRKAIAHNDPDLLELPLLLETELVDPVRA